MHFLMTSKRKSLTGFTPLEKATDFKAQTVREQSSLTGFTLVEIMIVVAIVALLAAIAIPNLLRVRLLANESAAKATLKALSTAAELYSVANAGVYPASENALTSPTPPYLSQSICGQSTRGYTYTCATLSNTGYTVIAAPTSINVTGNTTYTVTTGGILTP